MTTSNIKISDKIIGKILIAGAIRNTTPLIMGKGEGETIDKEVVRGYGGVPYIPATAFVGALKSYCKPDLTDGVMRYFWGGHKDSDSQSHFIVDDLCPTGERGKLQTVIRDGIRIDHQTGMVEERKKFNYEVLEPGTEFSLRCEITLRDPLGWNDLEETIIQILAPLKNAGISFGAMTTRGFGRVILKDGWMVYHFDFQNKGHGPAWLQYVSDGSLSDAQKITGLKLPDKANPDDLIIEAAFRLNSALMIGAYPSDPAMPDKVHIQSGGMPILPGTSIRGAIRSRAEKIVNTLGGDGEDVLKAIFGWVNDEKKERAVKSRVILEEKTITSLVAEIQSRIRIDRFTGGTADTALFDSMPLWCASDGPHVYLRLRMPGYRKEDQWIAGLLLQVLKDLWTGDLPVGGEKSIGRGVLTGKTASITLGRFGCCTLAAEKEGISFSGTIDKAGLNACAKALNEKFPPTGGQHA